MKAAAGAAEAIPILSVQRNAQFLQASQAAGWKVFVSGTPAGQEGKQRTRMLTASNLGSPLRDSPCLLVLGSEEKGLFADVRRTADLAVVIEGARSGEADVESLNVSVAAGILCEAFLRKPEDVMF